MGWLWTCLGGGPSIQAARASKAHRGKLEHPAHDLRLRPLPTQLPRNGFDPAHLQELPSRGKCGEPDTLEAFKVPTTSVNTCISINTLKKASERSLESSCRREFGHSVRSDVEELREELAALRRRLASEEAEARKLREEVNYLRSCGVLQRSEDSSSDERLPARHGHVEAEEDQQRHGDIAPAKQLRKCFSGPLLFDVHSPPRREFAVVPYATQSRISSHRVGLSPKPQGEDEGTQKTSKVSLSSNLQQYPSTKVAAWTSQTTDEGYHDGTSKDLVILDSMDVHWIEVANAPCTSGFSTNVRREEEPSADHAESPRRAMGEASGRRLIGKRRQSKRSMDLQEPTEKRSREQSLVLSSQLGSLTPEQVEEQLAQAVASFRQQKLELEAKHQASFCQGPSTSPNRQASANPGVVGVFRNSRRKSHRNRVFQRSLSPVKEALSIEEITWRNESSKPDDLMSCNFMKTVSNQGFKFSAQMFEISPSKSERERPSTMESIAMVPIQCASPSLSPKKKPSSLDALYALAVNSKTPAESRYLEEGPAPEADWVPACNWEEEDEVEGTDMKPIECASPSFSERRKSSRSGPVRQSVAFEAQHSSPLMASSNEFLDEVFGTKSTPPSEKTPLTRETPSPRTHWTPSPRSSPMMSERSWYCDAIDAIQSINDIRSSKERRLLTESVSLGNSPAGRTQRQPGPRNPHAFSAEKKVLRRAFSWYVTEHDERMKTVGLKERFPEREREEPELCDHDNAAQKPNRGQLRESLLSGTHPNPSSKKGVLHSRRFSDSDSGASATFSIDLTPADSPQNEPGGLDARDSNPSAPFTRQRVDKENSAAAAGRIGQAPSMNSSLRASDQSLSSSDSNKYLRRSQESIPENRSVLGSVPFNHWDRGPAHLYSEDMRGERHQGAGTKPSSRGVPAKLLMRSRSFM